MHRMGIVKLNDLNWEHRRYRPWLAYGQSKMANLLFTSELQRRLVGVNSPLRALAAHPGYSAHQPAGPVGSPLGDVLMFAGQSVWPPMPNSVRGRRCTRRRRTCRVIASSGPRFGCGDAPSQSGGTGWARRDDTAAGLWELSEQLTDTKFSL